MQPSEFAGNRHLLLPKLPGCRILAVDDDANALMLLRELLEMTGAVVETATSAEAALEILRARTPNVLVSDLSMPQMSGLDLIDRIRASQHSGTRALPAIA
jgi:CheY-like chemotaxis protein